MRRSSKCILQSRRNDVFPGIKANLITESRVRYAIFNKNQRNFRGGELIYVYAHSVRTDYLKNQPMHKMIISFNRMRYKGLKHKQLKRIEEMLCLCHTY